MFTTGSQPFRRECLASPAQRTGVQRRMLDGARSATGGFVRSNTLLAGVDYRRHGDEYGQVIPCGAQRCEIEKAARCFGKINGGAQDLQQLVVGYHLMNASR